MTNLVFGVVADDLTGGMETAAMLVRQGVNCAFVTDPDVITSLEDVDAVVVAQKTRVVTRDVAIEKSRRAARALLERGARQVYFKYCATFDSTDEGNIGPVTDLLMAMTGASVTGFCPSSPELKRTVYNGHLFLGTQLISDSPKRFDPLTPMTDPDLVKVLQRQTARKVGLLAHPVVAAGGNELADAVATGHAEGIQYFIADAIYDSDLERLAVLTRDWKLMTGNATLVPHYPALWRDCGLMSGAPYTACLPAVKGSGVVLAGSCAERTLEQLAVFERSHPVLRIDLTAVGGVAEATGEALRWALSRLDAGPVGIATSAPPQSVAAAQAHYGRDGAATLAEDILGGIAAALHESGVRRFMVAGGETSGAVVKHLGITRLDVEPYGGPGIGNGTTRSLDPVAICLKSGKLGSVDLFEHALESMKNPEVRHG